VRIFSVNAHLPDLFHRFHLSTALEKFGFSFRYKSQQAWRLLDGEEFHPPALLQSQALFFQPEAPPHSGMTTTSFSLLCSFHFQRAIYQNI